MLGPNSKRKQMWNIFRRRTREKKSEKGEEIKWGRRNTG
jgi:hypothetical protein